MLAPYCPHCEKNSHRSQREAYQQIAQLFRAHKHAKKPGRLAPYQCPHGYGWHIGHTPPKPKRRDHH